MIATNAEQLFDKAMSACQFALRHARQHFHPCKLTWHAGGRRRSPERLLTIAWRENVTFFVPLEFALAIASAARNECCTSMTRPLQAHPS